MRNLLEKLGIGRRIDELGEKLKKWPHVRKIVYTLLFTGCFLLVLIIPLALQTETNDREFYRSLGVEYEFFSVDVPSHDQYGLVETISIEGIALYPIDAPDSADQSVPAILQINGANNRKERNHDMSIQLVKRGMAVFIIEQRGHGESGGRGTYYGEEPGDVPHVLDYLTENYEWINSTHFGALGFSLGAGCLLIAQALDSRLYACSLFHPPTDIGGILGQVDISHITGSFLFQPPSYAPEGVDPMEARTAFYWCNSRNTANVLMLQGDVDSTVPAEDTIRFNKSLEIQNRDDVQLIMRPGLEHEPNEADITSRKYAIAWLLHFFGDAQTRASIDLSDLKASLESIELYAFNPPDRSGLKNLAWAGMFIIEFGILFYGIVIAESSIPEKVKKIKRKIQLKVSFSQPKEYQPEEEPVPPPPTSPIDSHDPQALFFQQIIFLALLILPTAIILGIINGFTNPNLLFGLFLELPIIVGLIFHFTRTYYGKEEKHFPLRILDPFPFPAPERHKDELLVTTIMTIFLFIPPLLVVSLYDWAASRTMLWPVNFWKMGFLVYLIALGSLFYVAHAFVKSFLEKGSYAGVIGLTFLWILGASQYLLFNPVTATFGNVTLAVIIVFGFGLAMTFMGLLHRSLKKVFGKVIVIELITAEIIALWMIESYMNLI